MDTRTSKERKTGQSRKFVHRSVEVGFICRLTRGRQQTRGKLLHHALAANRKGMKSASLPYQRGRERENSLQRGVTFCMNTANGRECRNCFTSLVRRTLKLRCKHRKCVRERRPGNGITRKGRGVEKPNSRSLPSSRTVGNLADARRRAERVFAYVLRSEDDWRHLRVAGMAR